MADHRHISTMPPGLTFKWGAVLGVNYFFINNLRQGGDGHISPYSSNMLVGNGGEPLVNGLTPSISLCGAGGLLHVLLIR